MAETKGRLTRQAWLLPLLLLATPLAFGAAPAVASPAASAPATVPASATALEDRVNRLASELRCLVCQNQSIADSHSELAVQLKGEVRAQLARGATEDQVRDFMVQRYGDFVLYRPPLSASTVGLWAGPALLVSLGMGLAWFQWRERRRAFDGAPDSALPEELNERGTS